MEQVTESRAHAIAICDALGRKNIAVRLGRTVAAVSNAATDGVFPSSWYLIIKQMCEEEGVDCPDAAFAFLHDDPPDQAGVRT